MVKADYVDEAWCRQRHAIIIPEDIDDTMEKYPIVPGETIVKVYDDRFVTPGEVKEVIITDVTNRIISLSNGQSCTILDYVKYRRNHNIPLRKGFGFTQKNEEGVKVECYCN